AQVVADDGADLGRQPLACRAQGGGHGGRRLVDDGRKPPAHRRTAPAVRRHPSPMTWMNTLRRRARSSSQKKIFCHLPSVSSPSITGIVCEAEPISAARQCECPFGTWWGSPSSPSVRIERSSWRYYTPSR